VFAASGHFNLEMRLGELGLTRRVVAGAGAGVRRLIKRWAPLQGAVGLYARSLPDVKSEAELATFSNAGELWRCTNPVACQNFDDWAVKTVNYPSLTLNQLQDLRIAFQLLTF